MLGNVLKKIGFTFRSCVLLSIFLGIFISGSIVTLFFNNDRINITWLICLVPPFAIFLLLLYAITSAHNRKILKSQGKGPLNEKSNSISRKFYIAFACHGTYVAIGILLICFFIIIGHTKYLFEIFGAYVFVGWIVVYKIMWPFFNHHLK